MFYPVPNKTRKAFGRVSSILAVVSILVAAVFISNATVDAAAVPTTVSLELGWDPNPEIDVVGYWVYIGTLSGEYSRIEEADLSASYEVTGLTRGLTYYFAVSAFNDQGVEGPLSDELVVAIDTPPLPKDAGVVLGNAEAGPVLRWSFLRSALTSAPEMIIEKSKDLITWTEAAVVWSGDYTGVDGEKATYDWPIPTDGGGSWFFRLTARNWLGHSTQP